MVVLRNIAFNLCFWSVSLVYMLLAAVVLLLPARAMQRLSRSWCSWHRWCVVHLLGITVVVEGAPSDEPALYAIKHESYFEAIDSTVLFHRPVPFAKAQLFKIPIWGRAALHYGMVPVDRSGGAKTLRHMIVEAKRFAAEGRPLVIFPEGTRVPFGEKRPLQSGFAGLYKMLAMPVIPVAVDSGKTYGKNPKRAGTITYRFGTPIAPGLERSNVEAQVEEAINALNFIHNEGNSERNPQ